MGSLFKLIRQPVLREASMIEPCPLGHSVPLEHTCILARTAALPLWQ